MVATEPAPSADAPSRKLTLSAILRYERADVTSGWLLLGMVVFSPWAFGTTQPWAILTMNLAGFSLSLLWATKLWIRHQLGHQPARWDAPRQGTVSRTGSWLVSALALGTALLLSYCLVAALNARADYDPIRLTLTYWDYLDWLPHSYDRRQTWAVFSNYLAWAGSFWALRDWLLGMTAKEGCGAKAASGATASQTMFPWRLRLLLWVLAVNGALLSIEAISQRLEGSGNLLFLVKPHVNPNASAQFGPFAYRSNAIQYLNLVWPVTLGFWWWLQSAAAKHDRAWSHHWLLLCVIVMAACPIISSSRTGALTGMALLAIAVALLISEKRTDSLLKLAALGVFGFTLAGGVFLGWQSLSLRLNELGENYWIREQMYQTARLITREHPVFGTGPGTFEHVFQLYRQSTYEYWPAQLHNDWLELRLTFGWAGFVLILAALGLAVGHWFRAAGIPASRRFIWLVWLALTGCLFQARWDFPFRIYSVVFLFLALCAVLTTVTKAGRERCRR